MGSGAEEKYKTSLHHLFFCRMARNAALSCFQDYIKFQIQSAITFHTPVSQSQTLTEWDPLN